MENFIDRTRFQNDTIRPFNAISNVAVLKAATQMRETLINASAKLKNKVKTKSGLKN